VKFSDKMNNMVMLPFRHCCAPHVAIIGQWRRADKVAEES
jgi:hypothetical protein